MTAGGDDASGGAGRVVCVGLATIDVVQYAHRLPSPGAKGQSHASWCGAGGPPANAAATIGLLGGAVTLVAPLGTDRAGELVRAELQRAGVDLVVPPSLADIATPVSSAWVTDDGDRTVLSTNAGADHERDAPVTLPDDTLAVLVDGSWPALALRAARGARERGLPVVLDGGSWKPVHAELLGLVDHAVCSARFALPTAPDAPIADRLAHLAGLVGELAAVTDGPAPIAWRRADRVGGDAGEPSGTGEVRPPSPARVVDTLAAGDVLHGAFVHHLAQRGCEPVEALRAAAAVAAASVAHRGPRAWADKGVTDAADPSGSC